MTRIIKKSMAGLLFFLIFAFFLNNVFARDWESYIRDGIYYAIKNGRAIKCGRVGEDDPQRRYEWYNYTDADDCWNHRCDWGMCKGEVPLCCYKLEETGNAKACAWPERGYCHPRQCDKISGDKLLCSHGIGYWCQKDCGISDKYQIPYIPFEQRVSSSQPNPPSNPTPTPTSTPTPTLTPTPTSTPYPTSPFFSPTPTPASFNIPTAPQPSPSPTNPSYDMIIPTSSFPQISLYQEKKPGSLLIPNINLPIPKINLPISQIKYQLKYTVFSLKKILDLPKVIFEDIRRLDKKMEEEINQKIKNIFFDGSMK